MANEHDAKALTQEDIENLDSRILKELAIRARNSVSGYESETRNGRSDLLSSKIGDAHEKSGSTIRFELTQKPGDSLPTGTRFFDKDPHDKDPHDKDPGDFDRNNFSRDNFSRNL